MESIPIPTATLIYKGSPTRGIDGDTFGLVRNEEIKIRLIGVNTPELYRGDEQQRALARQARDYTTAFIGEGDVIVRSYGKDSFGRDLALVWRVSDGLLLNRELIERGLGTEVPMKTHLSRMLPGGPPPRVIEDEGNTISDFPPEEDPYIGGL